MAHVPALTLERLDELAGLSRGHASQISRGANVDPRAETVRRIATVLGARASWLTFGEGPAPSGGTVQGAVRLAEKVHATPVRSRTGGRNPVRPLSQPISDVEDSTTSRRAPTHRP